MKCHDGTIEILPAAGTGDEVAACCAVCHAVLATGPRTEVCADL